MFSMSLTRMCYPRYTRMQNRPWTLQASRSVRRQVVVIFVQNNESFYDYCIGIINNKNTYIFINRVVWWAYASAHCSSSTVPSSGAGCSVPCTATVDLVGNGLISTHLRWHRCIWKQCAWWHGGHSISTSLDPGRWVIAVEMGFCFWLFSRDIG